MSMLAGIVAVVVVWAWWSPDEVGAWLAKAKYAFDQTYAKGGK